MRIALVDDSEIERGILLSLITDYGCEKQILFESDCFDSGDAFLSSFSSDKYCFYGHFYEWYERC